MVKSSLFSDNDMRLLDHLPRARYNKDPFRNDVVRRQVRSRLKRKIENDSVPFLASHLYEWHAIRTAVEYNLIDEALKTKLQNQVWDEKESLIAFMLEWLPGDKHAEFLASLFSDKYLDEGLKKRGEVDPLAPTKFLGPYLDMLRLYDRGAEKVRKRLVRDLTKFQELTGSKRSIVRFPAGKSEDDDLAYGIWSMEPLDFDHLMAYEHSEYHTTFVYVVPASTYEVEEHTFIKPLYCDIAWYDWILYSALDAHLAGRKSVSFNYMMNLGYRHVSFIILSSIVAQLQGHKEMMEDPAYSPEQFQKTILKLMGNYFDHCRTNRPGRPKKVDNDEYERQDKVFRPDKETTLEIEYFERMGGRGRKVPMDEDGEPYPGKGRGFKTHLRRRVNELVKLGLLNTSGRNFKVSDKGFEVARYGIPMGVTLVTHDLSLDWLRSGMKYYSKRYPMVSERSILAIMLNRSYPNAAFLNLDELLDMSKSESTSIQASSKQ